MVVEPNARELEPIPSLLRRARRAYAGAIQAALAEAGCDDVPRNGSYVLAASAREGAQLGQIIKELGVSKQAAGQLIDTLVSRGYLDRSVDPQDRRRLAISLTERGVAAAAVISGAAAEVDARLRQRVSGLHVEHAREVLAALAQLAGEPAGPQAAASRSADSQPVGPQPAAPPPADAQPAASPPAGSRPAAPPPAGPQAADGQAADVQAAGPAA